MPFGDRNFDFGVNMAWINGGTGLDLGRNPYFFRWGVCWSESLVRAYFNDISNRGFKVVRIWAFEKLEGLEFDRANFNPAQVVREERRNGHRVFIDNPRNYETWNLPKVTGIQSEFQNNVRTLMQIARDTNLEIYWTILSGGNYFKNPGGHHQWALKKMLENSAYRSRFIQNALRPFLQILRPFSDNVYAIDLINEPDGFDYWNFSITIMNEIPNIPNDDLEPYAISYIQEASDAVRPIFKVSAGFREKSTIEHDLGSLEPKLDFFDFHHYDTDSLDEDPISHSDKPTILGELGYMEAIADFTPNDSEQGIAINGIIGGAIARGFKGCFLWNYTPHSSSVDTNNLLIARQGYNKCARRVSQDFIDSFERNPNHFWRPVQSIIAARRIEIDRLNSTP